MGHTVGEGGRGCLWTSWISAAATMTGAMTRLSRTFVMERSVFRAEVSISINLCKRMESHKKRTSFYVDLLA